MRKVLFIGTMFLFNSLLTSCLYVAPSQEEVYEEMVHKLNYEQTYKFETRRNGKN